MSTDVMRHHTLVPSLPLIALLLKKGFRELLTGSESTYIADSKDRLQ